MKSDSFRLRVCHPLRRAFPDASPHHDTNAPTRVLQPPDGLDRPGLGSAPFARHYWGYHCCFLFLRLLRCFSSPGSPPHNTARMTGHHPAGLPHSDTPGSKAACASPGIFAACRVLHRLPEPRHPPCALSFFLRLTRLNRPQPSREGRREAAFRATAANMPGTAQLRRRLFRRRRAY